MSDNHWPGTAPQQGPGQGREGGPEDGAIIDLDGDLAESQDMGRPGFWERRRLRRVRRRAAARAAVRDYIEAGMPPDSDAGFDLDTFIGRAGWRVASSRWWWSLAQALVVLVVLAGWFILLYTDPPGIVVATTVGVSLSLPMVMLWLLGRRTGRGV
ncbi:hypothetical protein [Arthrobacter pigmenti]